MERLYAGYQALSWHLPGRIGKNHELFQCGWPDLGSEPDTSGLPGDRGTNVITSGLGMSRTAVRQSQKRPTNRPYLDVSVRLGVETFFVSF